MAPIVSVIVVSYNTKAMTLACLASVRRETELPHELIVFDNASQDGSAEAIASEQPDARLIASKVNLGFGRANNAASSEAKGRYVLLLNPDTVVLDGAIDRLVVVAERRPDALIWGGRTVFDDGSPNRTNCYQAVTLWRLFCRAFGLSALTGNHRFFSTAYGGWDMEDEREVGVVTGCFLLMPRSLWEGLGGFDPDFFLFDEETDLCMRACRDFGARPLYTPEAVIVHHGSASLPSRADRAVLQLRGRRLLIDKHFSGARRWLAHWMLWLTPLTRAAAERLRGRGMWTEVWAARRDWMR